MGRQADIDVPPALRPLLEQPAAWSPEKVWRLVAAACRARGHVAWSARLDPPGEGPIWLSGLERGRPRLLQSECVPALVAGLQRVPPGGVVEVIAPTSLRYLVEGRDAPPGTPEHVLADLAAQRAVWARYALGELEAEPATCLARAYELLEPLRWPGEHAIRRTLSEPYVLYCDGGCSKGLCAAAWVLRRHGETLAERCWTLAGPAERDGTRLAEFTAAVDGLASVPVGTSVAVVSDHVDLPDFGILGAPSFAPSPRVASALAALRELAGARTVHWYWEQRQETSGQQRCQVLIGRRLRAAVARERFVAACAAAGLDRLFLPDFARWLAPDRPDLDAPRVWPGLREQWSATFQPLAAYLSAVHNTPRLFLRQLEFRPAPADGLTAAFERSVLASWCATLERNPPIAGSSATYLARLRSGAAMVCLLFEPATGLLAQTRPGAAISDALDAARTVAEAPIPPRQPDPGTARVSRPR